MQSILGWVTAGILVCSSSVGAAMAGQYPVRPYVDPSQLAVPWPKHSFYRQPWRAFMETRSGYDFLHGIGINFNVPSNDELAVRLLAETGFSTFRIEFGWGNVNWEETRLRNEERFKGLLRLCHEQNVRPTILLNAHQGVPCPAHFFERKLTANAPKGRRIVRLDDVSDIVPKYTGLSNLTGYWAAEALVVNVNRTSGECQLSKPLPRDLKAGEKVLLATLKYLPLYPVGTSQFEATARGWGRYVELVLKLVRDATIADFDVEIWNELSFGSEFVFGINKYYDPQVVNSDVDFLLPGGHAWELARRTIQLVKREFPRARCIWGFSNTTFFHTPIRKLPPRTDGQSYHPYGTGTRTLPEQEYMRDRPEMNLDGYTPTLEIRMPEGWAHTFIQTESLMRLLNPQARQRRPEGTKRFYHYITEHGVVPSECGVHEESKGWQLKARCALRSFCLWLNKGIDVMHYFCAYDRSALGMGLLPPDLPQLPTDAPFERVATLPMKAVRNLTKAFAGSTPLRRATELDLDVVALGDQRRVFDGDDQHPPLWQREVFAALPFQLDDRRFIIALYVMTYDATMPMQPQRYQLTIKGLPNARLYDPLQDKTLPVKMLKSDKSGVTLEVQVVDYPRLLVLTM